MYFVSYAGTKPVPVNAKSLAGAKRAASQNCIFQGQTLHVFAGEDAGKAVEVARKAADPINMRVVGKWIDL